MVVIGNGSWTIKAGLGGDDAPLAVFPSIIGRPKLKSTTDSGTDKVYVGDDARMKREQLYLKQPIEHGRITLCDDMEQICHHTF